MQGITHVVHGIVWDSSLELRARYEIPQEGSPCEINPWHGKEECLLFIVYRQKSSQSGTTLTVLWYISANRQSCIFLILYSVEILVIETFPSVTFLSQWEKKYLYVYVNRTLIIYWIQDHIDKIKYWYTKKMILHFSCHLTVLPLRSHFKIWQKVE